MSLIPGPWTAQPIQAVGPLEVPGPVTHGRHRAFPAFITCTVVCGVGALFALDRGWHQVDRHPLVAVVLAGLLLVTELMPVVLLRRGAQVEVATSTTFLLAMMLSVGVGPALAAQVVSSLISDLSRHKHPLKIAFNLSQFAVAIAASGAILALGDNPPLRGGLLRGAEIAPAVAAAVVFLVINNFLVWTVVSLATGSSLRRRIRAEWFFASATSVVLAGLAPVIAFVADEALPMLPLLLIPVAAVYVTGRTSLAQAYQASHDSLTGLANRSRFRADLEETLSEAADDPGASAVFIIDVDRFKEINDTLGHHVGDLLLCQVGPRLSASTERQLHVARLGGDEFAVLLDDVEGSAEALAVAGDLARALQIPFVLEDGLMVELEASIGVAVTSEHGRDADLLLQRADVAMYVAKASKTGIELYAPERDGNTRRRLEIIGQLRTAIANDELTLFYQPKLSLATHQFFAVEALIRWFHPELGMVAPDEFIPLAERSGLIIPLTRFVLQRAINQAEEWRRAGVELRMAVNLSARSLLDESLPSLVAELLEQAGMEAATLELEITETELMADPGRAAMVLERLHAMGIRLTIDDFGTGYSSLAYLRGLPIDEIKIDRCFVAALAADGISPDDIIVRATIDLARNLGLEVTAEGVENIDQLERLQVLGCHFLQGFYLSRPLPADDIPPLLDAATAFPVVGT